MSLILYINGEQVDLEPNNVIAQTKQINDINSVSSRQANYTNRFKLPMTAKNIRILGNLSLPGNTSNAPYQKNECYLYSDSGECFVYKGWAVVTQSSDVYEVNIYDGIIDLYKAIENKSLADLGLEDLTHTKDLAAVYNSWSNGAIYRYILADYNGNTGNTLAGEVEIDYLVPAVSVKYLWDKIFEKVTEWTGVETTYTGSVFLTEKFKNLWMTFPKGVPPVGDNNVLVFHSDDYVFNTPGVELYYAQVVTTIVNDLEQLTNNTFMKPGQPAFYNIEITGVLAAVKKNLGNVIGAADSRIFIMKNSEGAENPINPVTSLDSIVSGNEFEFSHENIFIGPSDSLAVVVVAASNNAPFNYELIAGELDVKLYRVDPNQIDFSNELADFSAKDFMNEVIHRFGLTMFKDKYNNVYEFLTLQELLQTSEYVDWSDKFSKKVNESYIYGSYGQRNWFRYNYNDKEASYNDGYIDIANSNLLDTKDVLKSKIYSPESPMNMSMYLNRLTNVYKIWEKEIDEDGTEPIKYKPLDKRYYFMRAQLNAGNITLKSTALDESVASNFYYRESYYKLPFSDIIQDYYGPFQQILNKAQMVTAELWLKDTDIVNFDFSKLYYIKQLSSYFLVNKINNYVPGKVTKCELIRVHYSSQNL